VGGGHLFPECQSVHVDDRAQVGAHRSPDGRIKFRLPLTDLLGGKPVDRAAEPHWIEPVGLDVPLLITPGQLNRVGRNQIFLCRREDVSRIAPADGHFGKARRDRVSHAGQIPGRLGRQPRLTGGGRQTQHRLVAHALPELIEELPGVEPSPQRGSRLRQAGNDQIKAMSLRVHEQSTVDVVHGHSWILQCRPVLLRQQWQDQIDLFRVGLDTIDRLDRMLQDLGQQSLRCPAQQQYPPRIRMLAHPEVRQRHDRDRVGETGGHLAVAIQRVLLGHPADGQVLIARLRLGDPFAFRRQTPPSTFHEKPMDRRAGQTRRQCRHGRTPRHNDSAAPLGSGASQQHGQCHTGHRDADQHRLNRSQMLDGPEGEQRPSEQAAGGFEGVDPIDGNAAGGTVPVADRTGQREGHPDHEAAWPYQQDRDDHHRPKGKQFTWAEVARRPRLAETPDARASQDAQEQQRHRQPTLGAGRPVGQSAADPRSCRNAGQPRAQQDTPDKLAAGHEHHCFAQQQRLGHDRLYAPGQRHDPQGASAG